jgi:hypothetical protein
LDSSSIDTNLDNPFDRESTPVRHLPVVNLPLRAALKQKVEALPNGTAGSQGCADASLYRRFCEAGLCDVSMFPQLAAYTGARAHAANERLHGALSPDELTEWQTAVAQAEVAGTFFISVPFHCAVGTKS